MIKRKVQIIVVVVLAITMLVGCAKTVDVSPDVVEDSSDVTQSEQQESLYYPYISAVLELPYFIDHQVGLKLAGNYYGAKTATLGPSTYDMAAQISVIEQQIGLNPTALFISAFEDTLVPAINDAVDAGIPVFTIDMDTVESKRQTFIGGDTIDYGRVHARTMAEALDGEGKILLLYKIGQNSQDQRAFGFKDELTKWPGIEIVQEVGSETDASKDADALKAALQANPDVSGISTLVASGPVAAATAVRELGLEDQIIIVGDSKDDATLKLIENGELYATVAISTISENWYAAMLVDGLVKGNLHISQDDKAAGINALPEFIDIGTFSITQDTAKYFYTAEDPFDVSWLEVTEPEEEETYYLIGAVLGLPYFIDHGEGFEIACEELGVTCYYQGPTDYDMAAQTQVIEQAIEQGPAGLLIMAFEDTLAPVIDKAVDAGIPVVTIDMDTLASKRNFFVGGDTVEYGRIHARTIAEALNGEGKILLMWKFGQNSQDQRAFGFKDELKKYPGIEIVQEVGSETDTSKDADALKAALQANPDVTGISTLVASGPVAAATAVREMGLEGKVQIVGDSKDDATLRLLENGEIYATVAIKTKLEPYLAMKILYLMKHTNFAISQNDEAAGVSVLPNRVDIGTFVIYQDTAEYFYLEND
jgi:ribose transport system substrate-binding protein